MIPAGGVVHLDKFYAETAEIDGLSVLYDLALYAAQHVVLFEFMVN